MVPFDRDVWNGAVEGIRALRCDGVIEYCYEKNGIRVWGPGLDLGQWDITQQSNLSFHSVRQLPINPYLSVTPNVQRGAVTGFDSREYTAMQISRPDDPTKPALNATTHAGNGDPVDSFSRAIGIRWNDAIDSQSGIWGYFYVLDTAAGTIPGWADSAVRKVSSTDDGEFLGRSDLCPFDLF